MTLSIAAIRYDARPLRCARAPRAERVRLRCGAGSQPVNRDAAMRPAILAAVCRGAPSGY